MDGLIHHCLREISFDGDLGCDVSRLSHFIEEYYSGGSDPNIKSQTVDEAFRSFVWSLVVQEPSVTVGLVPEGSSPVYIAPQPSVVRKQAKAQSAAPLEPSNSPAKLESLASAEVQESSLPELIQKYGETLRIAVDHETSFQAITGTHVRSPKLGAMTYTALQFITRSRAEGISMKGLGEATGYDQKTVHYLIGQLLDLGLILKIRISGISKHACIHKYFYPKSRFYVPEPDTKIETDVEEEGERQSTTAADDAVPSDSIFAHDPIDPKALVIDSVLRSRLLTLLKNSPNHLHRSENIILALGCINPTRPDRRFVNHRVRIFMKEGWIEKVYAPNKKSPKSRVLCIRLVDQQHSPEAEGFVPALEEELEQSGLDPNSQPLMNVSLQHQILKLIQESGSEGMTTNDIAARLGNLDRRTLDHMITKLLRDANPPHLADLTILQMRESLKREHRHKYYTVQHYGTMLEEIGAASSAKTSLPDINENAIGGWGSFAEDEFYQDESDLLTRAPPNTRLVYNQTKSNASQKRTNPIGPDGKYIKGRPRNDWAGGVSRPTKKKKVEPRDQLGDEDVPKPKKRGRKRKASEANLDGAEAGPIVVSVSEEVQPPPKRKRGRPKKSEQTKTPTVEVHQPTPVVDLPSSVAPAAVDALDLVVPSTAERPSQDAVMQDVELIPSQPLLSSTLSPTTAAPSAASTTVPLPTVGSEGIEVERTTSLLPDQTQASLAAAAERGSPMPQKESPAKRTRTKAGVSSNQEQPELPKGPDALSILAETASRQPRGMGVNITYMRREKEILHLIAEDGGASLADWTLTKRHTALVEKWDKEGRQVSGPAGTSCDKRTMATLIGTMEDHGVIKKLVTTIPDGSSNRRQVPIIFTPETTEDAVQNFVENLKNRVNTTRALSKHSYRYAEGVYSEVKAPSRNAKTNAAPGDIDLANVPPRDARMELLQDVRTCAQLFGFIAGRMARARELHLHTISRLSDSTAEPSPGIVSKSDFIVSTSYFWTDIPISTFCSLVSVNVHSAALEDILADVEKRDTRVSELPQELRDALETGKARSRYKIAEVLDLLRRLGVVVPLQASGTESTPAAVKTSAASDLSFTLVQQNRTPPVDVQYWQFNLIAPVYRFSDPEKPSLLGQMPIATVEESVEYWMACREAAVRKDYVFESEVESEDPSIQFDGDSELRRSITRFAAWSNEYRLSGKQMDYLSRFVDGATGTIPRPVDANDENDPFNVLCYAAAAPPVAVTRYLEHMSRDIKANHERKAKEQSRKKKATDMQDDARKLLALKVKQAKQKLQDDWDVALAAVHPEPLAEEELKSPALLRLKRSFIAAGGNLKAEALHSAIKEALSPRPPLVPPSSKAKLPISRPAKKAPPKPNEPPPPPVSVPRGDDPISKSVLDLVNRQQPRKHETSKEKKERRATTDGPQKRGQRFLWSTEYNELAIDAACILAARGRSNGTMSWMAMPQVFPGVDSNGVRTRISKLREDAATEAYMLKLEEAWYHLWMQKRETDELPDSNPDSLTKLDLISHVVYLRNNIDKAQLRSGSPEKTWTALDIDLPSTVMDLERDFEVLRVEDSKDDQWDFIFNLVGDEIRERNSYRESFRDEPVSRHTETLPELDGVARAAFSMLLETPGESYNVDVASSMLDSCGEQHVANAISSLEKENCITKVISDPTKHVPGRHWRWQEWLEDFKSGPLHTRFYSGAQSFADELEADGQQDLPYVISDGTMVALLNMVSEDKIAVAVDTSHPAEVRHEVDGNSKKVVDDQLETSINIRLKQLRIESGGADSLSPLNEPERPATAPDNGGEPMIGIEPATNPLPHGVVSEPGQDVCCANEGDHSSYDVFNCDACLQTSRWTTLSTLEESSCEWVEHVLGLVNDAGPVGLPPSMLDLDDAKYRLLDLLTSATVPLVLWGGYTSPLLVGSKYASAWTVSLPVPTSGAENNNHVRMILPRLWLDIHGNIQEKTWNGALKHVVGWVWLRPKISLLNLRSRVKPLFDRQEVLDIVRHLVRKGTLGLQWDPSIMANGTRDIRSLTDDDSKKVWLSVKDEGMKEPWYTMAV